MLQIHFFSASLRAKFERWANSIGSTPSFSIFTSRMLLFDCALASGFKLRAISAISSGFVPQQPPIPFAPSVM